MYILPEFTHTVQQKGFQVYQQQQRKVSREEQLMIRKIVGLALEISNDYPQRTTVNRFQIFHYNLDAYCSIQHARYILCR